MFYISEIANKAPSEFETELQERVYTTLQQLNIAFERVETDEAISMEDCVLINQKLSMQMVKTLFLCNRQQTEFYLLVTTADKPFRANQLSNSLGISRLSFAPVNLLQTILGTKVGAATVFSLLRRSANEVKVLIDEDIILQEWYGCSDGTTRGYLKIRTERILGDFLSFAKHTPKIIQL